MEVSLDKILIMATDKGASDVHLKAGIKPVIRKHGSLQALSSSLPILSGQEIENMAFGIMDEEQKEKYKTNKDVDLSYGVSGYGRFRINIFQQRGSVRMVVRYIPDKVRSISELTLPKVIEEISEEERGLVLVTGATGSGKSSTLAAMINHINTNRSRHILMIEDPTEFLIKDKKSLITQRELGADTISFASSLRSALRQDPDVILIGEMRDRETIEIALLAAETGHLVFSTLHTLDAQETINRVLAAFEPHQQPQVRLQLASVLRSVISQRLCVKKDGTGYAPALEVMINNARVAECIAEPEKTHDLRRVIEEGRHAWKMQSFDQCLMDMLHSDLISYEEALKNSTAPENFAIRYSGVSHSEGEKWDENTDIHQKVNDQWQNIDTVDLETKVTQVRPINEKKSKQPPPVPGKRKGKPQKAVSGDELIKLLKKFKG